ncbi:hypothetical protein BGX27_010624 [Mortierella sp. AM989]|nr:hypothetical protein BGX27_010624 [Mortierella sp. AM989]
MENPVEEIPYVIHSLTQGTPAEQKHTLDTYFTPDSAFMHPYCRVFGFSDHSVPLVGIINSRWVIWMIYRWYKVLSPKIALEVHSVVLDDSQNVLYIQISQVFSLWYVPYHRSHVHLLTQLHLSQSSHDKKYYIHKQEDHYQINEMVKFIWPNGDIVLTFWQFISTLFCIIGSLLFAPKPNEAKATSKVK